MGIDGASGARGGALRVGDLARGGGVLVEGLRLLRRERSLWSLSVVPLIFSALALVAGAALLYHNASAIDALIQGALPVPKAGAWYTWLWIGPAKLAIWLLDKLVWLITICLTAVLSLMIANVAAAPFLDALAYRVERIVTGSVIESEASGAGALFRDVLRSMGGEAQRLVFFLSIWVVLFAVGVVIPGAHLVTGPAMVVITMLFLPLEYAGYILDRRQVPFASRRRWIVDRWPHRIGFGAVAFAVSIVPGLNLLMIPGLVVSGTLLVLADPPPCGTGLASAGRPGRA